MTRRVLAIASIVTCVGMCAQSGMSEEPIKVVKISAKRFEFVPKTISIKKGTPVVFEFTTEDRSHGFSAPALNLRSDIAPGKVSKLSLTPQKAGDFDFFCDVFCGSDHENMSGKITVTD